MGQMNDLKSKFNEISKPCLEVMVLAFEKKDLKLCTEVWFEDSTEHVFSLNDILKLVISVIFFFMWLFIMIIFLFSPLIVIDPSASIYYEM